MHLAALAVAMQRALLLLAVLTAGCVASPDGADVGDSDDAPGRVANEAPTTLADCVVVEALTKFPAATLAPHLPEGFEPAADATGAFAVLGGAECAEGGSRGILAIEVRPTDETLLATGVARYYWEPEHHMVDGGAFAAQVLALGGNVSWANVTTSHAPTGAALRIAGNGWEHAIEIPLGAIGPGPSPLAAGVFREYFAVAGGYGYLQASFVIEATTPFGVYPGVVSTGEGTVARAIFGAQSQRPAGVLVTDYADAVLGFIPYG